MKRVGIDIGGTNLRCAILDDAGNIVDKMKVENNQELSPEENLDKVIDFIISKDYRYTGIGIGAPGPLNIRQGKFLNPPNLPRWTDFEIVRYVEEKTGLKTVLNSDANVAAFAEARLGSAQRYETVYYITISTGVGAGFIMGGQIISGANSTAAEIYNMIINEDTYCHNGVNPGSVNEQCSGVAIARIASEVYGRDISTKELFDLYYDNDRKAIEIVETCADNLAKAVANICFVVDPEIFVFGGSVANYHPKFVDMIFEKAKKYVINPQFLYFTPSKFGDDAGLIGASLLV